jgi:hypothetical protein
MEVLQHLPTKSGAIFNILQSDVGRPISDFKSNLENVDLEKMLREVIETLEPRERAPRARQGRHRVLARGAPLSHSREQDRGRCHHHA